MIRVICVMRSSMLGVAAGGRVSSFPRSPSVLRRSRGDVVPAVSMSMKCDFNVMIGNVL